MLFKNNRFYWVVYLWLGVCLTLRADTKTTTTTESKQAGPAPGSYLVEICSVRRDAANPDRADMSCSGQVLFERRAIAPAPAPPAAPGDRTCAGLFPAPPAPPPPPPHPDMPDASLITPLLGNPVPYSVSAQGKDRILIYSTKPAADQKTLRSLLQSFADIVQQVPIQATGAAFSLELTIPHAGSLGDLAIKLQTLGYAQLQITDVGYNRVRITDKGPAPACDTWRSFLRDARSLLWQLDPQSPVEKLYYLSASDVNTAFGGSSAGGGGAGGAGGGGSPGSASAAPGGAAAPAGMGTGGAGQGGGAGSSAQGGGAPAGAAPPTGPTGATTVTMTSPQGTTTVSTTPGSSPATPAAGNMSAGTPGSPNPPSSGGVGAPAGAGGKPSTSVAPLGSDLLVFSDATPGDDSSIDEKKRILAALDLPRPEMIINAWVMQNSTTDRETFGQVSRVVHRTVHEHNDGLNSTIADGWTYLKRQMVDNWDSYFNTPFYNYVTRRVIFDAGLLASPGDRSLGAQSVLKSQERSARETGHYIWSIATIDQRGATEVGDVVTITTTIAHGLRVGDSVQVSGVAAAGYNTVGAVAVTAVASPVQFSYYSSAIGLPASGGGTVELRVAAFPRNYAGSCDADKYCLGYTTLFQPLEPRLTNLLLALIAADDPVSMVNCSVNFIERWDGDGCPPFPASPAIPVPANLQEENDNKRDELGDIALQLKIPNGITPLEVHTLGLLACEERDQAGILSFMDAGAGNAVRSPRLFLECFREIADQLLRVPSATVPTPSALGLTRAAVADFLFNYKMSQQYPHEFVPYDLTQSADRFNSAISPLITAFNRDLTAYQGLLQARVQVEMRKLNSKVTFARAFGFDRPTFLNDGIVTVNTVSGNEAIVNTTTQSYIDVSTAPSLSSLVSAVAGEGASSGNVGTSHLTKPMPGVLANLSFNQAQVLLGALSAYQSSKAQIGRQLNVDVTPRSLVGASAAELQVTLKADDSASPPIYSSGGMKGADPEVSRFATNETTTHVRVDSVKLFEVSSFSAVLQNRRPRLPLLPPFVELPYIGTLVGVPLPAAQQYHSSTAVLSAVVVPTATDLAYGIRFLADRIVEEGPEQCAWPPPQTPAGAAEEIDYARQRPCKLRHAESLADFASQPIREFNRMMVQCFATDMESPNPNQFGFAPDEASTCVNLNFGRVLHDWAPSDAP